LIAELLTSIYSSLATGAVATTLSIFGALFITLLIAARPPRRKARCISRIVSALSA